MKKIRKLAYTDPRGTILYAWGRIFGNLYASVSTFFTKIKLGVYGVSCGRRTSFRGRINISRYPGTKISIGSNCIFNSNYRFNARGINHRCSIATGPNGNIEIGNWCGFSGVSIVSSCHVKLGNNVMCGTNVMIGDRNDHEDLYPEFKPEPVIIGNNVWIGMNVVVMKGVTIGDNVIIGANSIVTKDIPANTIAVGSPCKVIKERS